MRTVCVVITARPSYARVRTLLEAVEQHGKLQLQLVVTGSALLRRYGSVIEQIQRTHKVDVEILTTIEGDTHAAMVHSTANLATQLGTLFCVLKPDVVVSIADRYETLGTAMAAAYMNIPLAHIQGGELTGSIDDKVRHAVTQLADLHFVSTMDAADRIVEMRLGMAKHIYVTGCPSIDIAARVVEQRGHWRFNPWEVYGGVGPTFDIAEPYYVVLQHPVTTHAESSRTDMLATLMAVRDTGRPAFIFWPNVDSGADAISKTLREFRERLVPPPWHFFRHMDAEDFLHLLLGAEALVGNSSVGIREGSFLGVPVVNVGDRQQSRERGPNVIDVAADPSAITQALGVHAQNPRPRSSTLYGSGIAGEAIAQHLATVDL